MDPNLPYISQLLQRYMIGAASEAEATELFRLLDGQVDDTALESLLDKEWDRLFKEEGPAYFPAGTSKEMLLRIVGNREQVKPVPVVRRLKRWGMVAASVLLIVLAGGYFLMQRPVGTVAEVHKGIGQDALPGKKGAVLTLADGTSMVLDTLPNGEIALQGAAKLVLKHGELTYALNGDGTGETSYNTITTPRGRQFIMTLLDGTKVWLNAASSLRYPTTFNGPDRRVEVTGEAYFEVAKDAAKPFYVKINDATEVEVLGTHFNVNAYTDEASINTTLLEGSVKVVSGNNSKMLRPGEQARVKGASINLVKNADIVQAVAWKNGLFSFTDADLPTVMRQIARWYNVEVEYAGQVPKGVFTGEIDNVLTLEQLLDGLTTTINYRIENGNKLIILP